MKLLLVDDEPRARARLRELLADMAQTRSHVIVGEAANGVQALELLRDQEVDGVLCDIRMPLMDGIELAGHLTGFARPPAVIFVTAYENYAVQAFELNAIDYLLKPVRAQRLAAALDKIAARGSTASELSPALAGIGAHLRGRGRTHISCHERGRLLLVPVDEILYFRADLKYVTARTKARGYLLEEALTHLEEEYADRFLRLHRSVLVARSAVAGFERGGDDDADAYGWALLRGIDERLPVSRRQWALVREMLSA